MDGYYYIDMGVRNYRFIIYRLVFGGFCIDCFVWGLVLVFCINLRNIEWIIKEKYRNIKDSLYKYIYNILL